MSAIQITKIDASYAQVFADLGRRLFKETYSSNTTPENMAAYLDESFHIKIQEKELNNPNYYTFMAFDDNKTPVGFAQMRQNETVYEFVGDPEAIELRRIYVDKNCAGKHIGSKLMAACLAKAKELNKETMWLGVWGFNTTAVKFYSSKGFYKVGTRVFKTGDQVDEDNVMILKL